MISDIACPTCLTQGIETALQTAPGRFAYFCGNNHSFNDLADLMAMNPKRLKVAPPPPKVQPGQSTLNLLVPASTVALLTQRFGEPLNASASVLLGVMTDPEAFVVMGGDAQQLQKPEYLGQKVPHSQALVGMVYALKIDRDEWKKKAEQHKEVAAGANEVEGDFVQLALRLPTEKFQLLADRAKFNGFKVADFVRQVIEMALENAWV